MPLPTSINDLSTTAASNSPAGTENPQTFDDYLRVYASYIAALRDVSLSGTANLSTASFAYGGTLTGSTGVVNIGAGQIYKDASGNVGIGTAAPVFKLHVQGSGIGLVSAIADASLTVAGTSTSALFGTDASGAYVAANGTTAMRVVTSGVERWRIDGAGAMFVTLPSASPTVPIGAMSFHRVSDTVVRMHMRGADNVQRYVDFTLTP